MEKHRYALPTISVFFVSLYCSYILFVIIFLQFEEFLLEVFGSDLLVTKSLSFYFLNIYPYDLSSSEQWNVIGGM